MGTLSEREKAWKRQYYAKNREKISEQRKQKYVRNRETYIAKTRANYWKDPEQSRRKARDQAAQQYKTEERKQYLRDYAKRNAAKVKEWKQSHKRNNREKIRLANKEYYYRTLEKQRERGRSYRLANRQKETARASLYQKTRKQRDPHFKMLCLLSSRIRKVLKKHRKSKPTKELTGLTGHELASYLQAKFKPGMSWENHGRNGWHIDHIKPCVAFDLNDHEQQRQCFHYTNLQPLWWWENLSKKDNLL